MNLNQPELTQKALDILRNPETFQWYFIPLLAFVVYIYFNEISKKNWNAVAAGLSLYMVHWLYEIANALIQHFSGHALWTVPEGTSYLLLVGVDLDIEQVVSDSFPGRCIRAFMRMKPMNDFINRSIRIYRK